MEKSKTRRTELKAMRLDSHLVKRVNEMAEKENRSFTNMVETLLIQATRESRVAL